MAILDNFSGLKSFITGTQGSSLTEEWFGTPYGGNTIAEPTLTKAQKTFSSKDVNPNLPKPKTLYFTYFHLNPALADRIEYKNKFIKTLLEKGGGDGMIVDSKSLNKASNEVYSQLKDTLSQTFS